jgi:hypothetical protein
VQAESEGTGHELELLRSCYLTSYNATYGPGRRRGLLLGLWSYKYLEGRSGE